MFTVPSPKSKTCWTLDVSVSFEKVKQVISNNFVFLFFVLLFGLELLNRFP